MTAQRIAMLGECMIELQQNDGQLVQAFGGDTLNSAIYFARLTQGSHTQVSYLTGLGFDTFSDDMLNTWQQENIDTQHVHRSLDKKPGLYMIETDHSGERTFHYWRNDSAAKYWLENYTIDSLSALLLTFDWIYLSGISLAILTDKSRAILLTALQNFKAQGGQIGFDNNYRPHLWHSADQANSAYEKLLAITDIALLTFEDETMRLGPHSEEACILRTHQLGVSEVVIKRGAKPCIVSQQQGGSVTQFEVAATPAHSIIDTTAAGDSFSAAYLASRLTNNTPHHAALSGHQLASQVIQHKGAIIPTEGMPPQSLMRKGNSMTDLNRQLNDIRVVPVIAISDANKAAKLAAVLVENGLPCAEVTFRTPAAAQAIKNMRDAYPDMLIGAGTVLSTKQVDAAIDAGVDFVVSPGFNPTTVKYCQHRNVPIIPGVNNPSLVEQAMELGLDTLKFFPAEPSGGISMLKALTAVYPVQFMPTGGIGPNNVNDYLNIKSVIACGGTWMVPAELIEKEQWDELAQLVRNVASIID